MRSRCADERGQILPALAVLLVVILAGGLVLFQVGRASTMEAEAVTAADAAALAGAQNVKEQLQEQLSTNSYNPSEVDPGRVRKAAADYAERNGATVDTVEYDPDELEVRATVQGDEALDGDAGLDTDGQRAPAEAAAKIEAAFMSSGVPAAGFAGKYDGAIGDTIYRVGTDLGVSDICMLAAFETAIVESGMQNLPYGDRDSLGVFQQRPSQGWGTPEQIMDVSYSAAKFFEVCMQMPQTGVTPGQLAQSVQRSAFPERYDQVEPQARAALQEAAGNAGGGAGGGDQPPASASGNAVVAEAEKYLGTYYGDTWGGLDVCVPYERMDCTCLTHTVFKAFGYDLPDWPEQLINYGEPVTGEPQPGDLVVFGESAPGSGGHAGIAVGGGKMIDAPYPGGSVGYHDIASVPKYMGARRLVSGDAAGAPSGGGDGDTAQLAQYPGTGGTFGPPSGAAIPGGLQPNAHKMAQAARYEGFEGEMGGVGPRPNKSDHPKGLAVDFMVYEDRALGDKVAEWVLQNADAFGVTYVIWYDRIATRSGNGFTWGPYTHPNGSTSNPTLRHLDHVHVSVSGDPNGLTGGGGYAPSVTFDIHLIDWDV